MDPAQVQAALQEAVKAMQAKRPDDMEAALAPVLEGEKSVPDALALKAIACNMKGKADEAIDYAKSAVALVPDHPNFLGTLGTIYAQAGKVDEAIETFRTLTDKHKDKPQAFYALGSLLSQVGRHDEAVAVFEDLQKLQPDQAPLKLALASAYYDASQFDKARTMADEVATALPQDSNVKHLLGKAALATGDAAAALAAFEATNEKSALGYMSVPYRHAALLELGRPEDAETLMPLDAFVFTQALAVPDGYKSPEEFNMALAEELLKHPRLGEDSSGKRHVPFLMHNASTLVQAFSRRVEQATHAFTKSITSKVPESGFLANAQSALGLDLSADVTTKQVATPPRHKPGAWVSAIYAVEGETMFEFGRLPPKVTTKARPLSKPVTLTPGTAVFFPSFMFHAPVAFEGAAPHVTCAIDVIPRSWSKEYRKTTSFQDV